MVSIQALIQQKEIPGPGYCILELLAPEIADIALPGQFIQVRVGSDGAVDPLLARPISLFRIDRGKGSVAILFKIVGRGTHLLAARKEGEIVTVFGPVGNGFRIPVKVGRIALIAGGVGMPPLYCLASDLLGKRPGLKLSLFYGGRSERDLLELKAWEQLGVEVLTATEDGSSGTTGFITAVLEETQRVHPADFWVACGPAPMLKAVQQLASQMAIPGLLSLESYMACGVGACLGCACRTNEGYRRVCVDGPVFALDEVIF